MFQFAKLMFYLFRGLIFDNKDEYDFKSVKFNSRKFIVLLLIVTSFVMNIWLLYRFVQISIELRDLREQVSFYTNPTSTTNEWD